MAETNQSFIHTASKPIFVFHLTYMSGHPPFVLASQSRNLLQSDRCQNTIESELMHSFFTSKNKNMERIFSSFEVNTRIYFIWLVAFYHVHLVMFSPCPRLSEQICSHPAEKRCFIQSQSSRKLLNCLNWMNKNSKERKMRPNVQM